MWVFSKYRQICMHEPMLSPVHLSVTPWTAVHKAPLSMGFSRQEYWSGQTFPSLGDFPDPGIKLESPVSPALAGRFFTTAPPGKRQINLDIDKYRWIQIYVDVLEIYNKCLYTQMTRYLDAHKQMYKQKLDRCKYKQI